MNEQQLAAVKRALKALRSCTHKHAGTRFQEWYFDEDGVKKSITALQSIIAQHALDKKAENARELGLSYDDAVKGGVGIMLGGKRIDPASIYAEPTIGCVNHDCDKCKAVQEPSLLEALKAVQGTLIAANEQGQLADTIWFSKYETLFDFIGAEIDKAEQAAAAQPAPVQEPVALTDATVALEDLKAVLTDPEGNVCWQGSYADRDIIGDALDKFEKFLTTPAAQPAVPLTDEQIHNLDPLPHKMFDAQRIEFARAIEAAHGITAPPTTGKTK